MDREPGGAHGRQLLGHRPRGRGTRAAFRDDGALIGLDYRFIDDVGGYIRSPEPASMYRCFGNFTGAYAVRNV